MHRRHPGNFEAAGNTGRQHIGTVPVSMNDSRRHAGEEVAVLSTLYRIPPGRNLDRYQINAGRPESLVQAGLRITLANHRNNLHPVSSRLLPNRQAANDAFQASGQAGSQHVEQREVRRVGVGSRCNHVI